MISRARAQRPDEGAAPPPAQVKAKGKGLYLYCVADSPERVSLGRIGLESVEVYTVPRQEICAVVHQCPAEPYQSRDQEVVKGWVLTHQRVVEAAWGRWGTVLPSTFDTIFQCKDDEDMEQTVNEWLTTEYDNLRARIARVRGKAEYGVQISWEPEVIGQRLTQTNGELAAMKADIASKPSGIAYLYQEKLKDLLRREMEAEANRCFQDFYGRIREHVDDLRVERTKKGEKGQQMILNLSCLASKEQSSDLGQELECIGKMEGFFVRFTGPWPPYSFVGGA